MADAVVNASAVPVQKIVSGPYKSTTYAQTEPQIHKTSYLQIEITYKPLHPSWWAIQPTPDAQIAAVARYTLVTPSPPRCHPKIAVAVSPACRWRDASSRLGLHGERIRSPSGGGEWSLVIQRVSIRVGHSAAICENLVSLPSRWARRPSASSSCQMSGSSESPRARRQRSCGRPIA